MKNKWWITRPKRTLNSVPEILAILNQAMVGNQWVRNQKLQLDFEELLEKYNIKKTGDRRDRRAGGGRTYVAWLKSLGLLFNHKLADDTSTLQLTWAGYELINGDSNKIMSPVKILTGQIFHFQFPSAYNFAGRAAVSPDIKIRPFVFLARLICDSRIAYLTEYEIGQIIIYKAKSNRDYERIVKLIRETRNSIAQSPDILKQISQEDKDVANTFVNWLAYTQLFERNNAVIGSVVLPCVSVVLSRTSDVEKIIDTLWGLPLLRDYCDEEKYQRHYGCCGSSRTKDTRALSDMPNITPAVINQNKIISEYAVMSSAQPISYITQEIISKISDNTGISETEVSDCLNKHYPHGSLGSFMTAYREMAFSGMENASAFEEATCNIMKDVFMYDAKHIGSIGLTPDVLVISNKDGYCGIIDNKAYSQYSITNDHHNRMVVNYINGFNRYAQTSWPLSFFMYIAGGFVKNIDSQIQSIAMEGHCSGSCIDIYTFIDLIKKQTEGSCFSHNRLKTLFSVNRRITGVDLQ